MVVEHSEAGGKGRFLGIFQLANELAETFTNIFINIVSCTKLVSQK